METFPFQQATLPNQRDFTEMVDRWRALGPNPDAALMRETIVAAHWFRAGFLGAIIVFAALLMLCTGNAGAAFALTSAGAGGALTLVAFRRARAACDRIDEAWAMEYAPAKDNDAMCNELRSMRKTPLYATWCTAHIDEARAMESAPAKDNDAMCNELRSMRKALPYATWCTAQSDTDRSKQA